ncbi:MAG TPA: DUF6340 family protein [Haliscomenobacter sp.]|uniref:DUF6340 family protein n=1 Tax=Haliscomenobacter sp. TaxID=2717303 RepID=UPI002BBD6FE5|nr:DUF6340 family protein [Haliscomenobacter sp.]HOY19310.1 DUF6340 family protein [Haliscomenobacter sp.]
MRNQSLLLLAVVALMSWSCGTSSTLLEVLQPSQIVLPEDIKVVALIDRSKPEKGFANFMEGAFSGEDFGQDREGRRLALQNLTTTLTRTPTLQIKGTGVEYTGSKNGKSMLPPLNWDEVKSICSKYGADAVIALESFDSSSDISYSQSSYKSKQKDGTEIIKYTHTARRNVRLYMGWRVYDPKLRVVVDENTTNESDEDTATGDTQDRARNNLRSQLTAVRELAAKAGDSYGKRIAPVWVNVSRTYYTTAKGADKDAMEQAHRLTQAGKWEEAAEVWNDLLNTARDPKTKGKAAHNLALAFERNGNLSKAEDWASKAYTQYGNKTSQNYVYVIQQRISDQARLDYQLKKVKP